MSMKIVTRSIGDISIVDCAGRNAFGEGSSLLRDVIRDLVSSGRRKIILNLAEVTYSDSSGQGELVSAFTTVTNCGGTMVLLKPAKRVSDLLRIQKLYTVFEIFDDEASAIRRLEAPPLHCQCPICGARSSPALLDGSTWLPQSCGDSNCGAQFALAPSILDPAKGLVESVRIPTYAEEYFEIAAGTPFRIAIVGRLNLFTSSGLSKLWTALPARIAIFDLHLSTEITPEGRDALLRLIAQPGKDERAAISLEGLTPEQAQFFGSAPPVYADNAGALAGLGDLVVKTPSWFARFD